MTPKTNIFLMTKDADTIHQVEAISKNGSPIQVTQVLPDMVKMAPYIQNSGVTTGIIDIDPAPEEILGELETLVGDNPHLCTVVVSHQINQDLILAAMQAGARHFLQKGSIQDQLSGVMGRLLTHTGAKNKTGSVLTVFSASGGCGATTVALNLANELRIKTAKKVLVIDLDRCYGAASAYLDVKSDYGIDDVLGYEGTIDRHLIQSSSCSYKDDFHVLLSQPTSNSKKRTDTEWDSQTFAQVIQACRQSYGFTVIDAPRMDEQTVRQLSEMSDFTIVVFQLTIKDVKFARSIITMFRDLGLSQDKIIPLANRFKKRSHMIDINDGKRVLGTDTVFKVRSDWRNAIVSLNKGKPLAETAPRSAIRKDLQKLVEQIQSRDSD